MDKLTKIILINAFLLLIDFYIYYAIKPLFGELSLNLKRILFALFWGISGLSVLSVIVYNFGIPSHFPNSFRSLIISGLFVIYFSKFFGLIFLMIDDVRRLLVWIYHQFAVATGIDNNPGPSDRLDFMRKATIVATAVPLSVMTFGIVSGAHDYRVKRRKIYLSNLPDSFDGIRIAQISDIHSGSFYNKIAVKGGVEMLLNEKPDLIFFTGDLVNNKADEFNNYFDVFKKIKAPLGVYSTLGNHDYGDYTYWPSKEAKTNNLKKLIAAHREMNWDILINENRQLSINKESMAILGVENWGTGRFPKYGDLEKAYSGTEDYPVKILLSHDPSHWDAQIRPQYPDIDITLAGHTHGFQFGIEIGDFKWSPSQYIYKQWADLYHEGNQYIYVNRGYGYLGFPGRVGILPEITILELNKA